MQERDKLITEILKYAPGPQRWRAAVNMWLKINPKQPNGLTARQENAMICKDNAEARVPKFATSSDPNSDLRHTLSMPEGALRVIQLADPMAISKENMGKFFRTFPEYTRSEKR